MEGNMRYHLREEPVHRLDYRDGPVTPSPKGGGLSDVDLYLVSVLLLFLVVFAAMTVGLIMDLMRY